MKRETVLFILMYPRIKFPNKTKYMSWLGLFSVIYFSFNVSISYSFNLHSNLMVSLLNGRYSSYEAYFDNLETKKHKIISASYV